MHVLLDNHIIFFSLLVEKILYFRWSEFTQDNQSIETITIVYWI